MEDQIIVEGLEVSLQLFTEITLLLWAHCLNLPRTSFSFPWSTNWVILFHTQSPLIIVVAGFFLLLIIFFKQKLNLINSLSRVNAINALGRWPGFRRLTVTPLRNRSLGHADAFICPIAVRTMYRSSQPIPFSVYETAWIDTWACFYSDLIHEFYGWAH